MERSFVLVVDDEPLVRRALRHELGACYLVLEASGPAEALELLEQHADLVAIVSDLSIVRRLTSGTAIASSHAEPSGRRSRCRSRRTPRTSRPS